MLTQTARLVCCLCAALCLVLPQAHAQRKKKKEDKAQPAAQTQTVATQTSTAPELAGIALAQFEQQEYNFGRVTQGELVQYVFKLKNAGGKALQILDVKPSCGCTATSYTREEIAPGQTGEVRITFNSAGKMGPQQKSISVVTNGDPAVRTLQLVGEVMAPKPPQTQN